MSDKIKIETSLQALDWVWEGLAFMAVVPVILLPIMEYGGLPDQVAVHFNAAGEPDRYGSKITIWLLPVVAIVTYIGMTVLARFPQNYNYPVEITDENRAYQYRLGARMIRSMNAAVTLMFTYIVYQIIQGAKAQQTNMGWGFIIVIMVGLTLLIGTYIYLAKKHK